MKLDRAGGLRRMTEKAQGRHIRRTALAGCNASRGHLRGNMLPLFALGGVPSPFPTEPRCTRKTEP